MQDENNKNFILAIALSVAVIVLWQIFYANPQMEERKRQLEIERQAKEKSAVPTPGQQAGSGTSSGVVPGTATDGTTKVISRTAALAASKRVIIDTPLLKGSIALQGGRIDDLVLKNYRVTTKKDSSLVTLLSPSGGPKAYFIEHGWVAPDGKSKAPTGNVLWTAPEGAKLTPETPLELTWDNGEGLVFKRTVRVDDGYLFTVTQSVENKTGGAVALEPYGRIVRVGTPTTSGFFVLHEGIIGFFGEQDLIELDYGDAIDEKRKLFGSVKGWLGITDKYWATALMPKSDVTYTAGVTGRANATAGAAGDFYQTDFQLPTVIVNAGETKTVETFAFAGAKEVDRINALDEKLNLNQFDLMIDWGWFWYITKPLFFLLDWLNKLFGNFGVAILATTVLIKAAFFPLANKSYVSMSKMKKLQPEMEKIKKNFEDDKQRQQQEMMKLYQKEKVNPLAGCLPVLLQIPVFFALYKVLFITIEMRHAPFFGWIQDLSAPDPTSIFNLFGLLPFELPQFLMLGIWPIIMGITMWVQMKLNPAPTDDVQKMIFTWMPIVFTFMLASFPAGLVIYWAWNNLLSIAQQSVIMQRQGAKIELWNNLKEDFAWLKRDKSAS